MSQPKVSPWKRLEKSRADHRCCTCALLDNMACPLSPFGDAVGVQPPLTLHNWFRARLDLP